MTTAKIFVTAQPTMIRGIRGAEAACSVHESPFGADDWSSYRFSQTSKSPDFGSGLLNPYNLQVHCKKVFKHKGREG